jgi:uncharacterized protein YdaU (DUF1376 family)
VENNNGKTTNVDKILTIPLHIGDALKDTYMMDATEFGAYMRLLLCHYNIGEQGLPDDDAKLARLAGCTPKVWQRVAPIVRDKFTWNGTFGKHNRVLMEIAKHQERVSKARTNGLKNKGHGKQVGKLEGSKNEANPIANPELTINHKPLDIDKSISPPTPKGVVLPDWVDHQIWKDFLEHRQKLKAPMTDKAKKMMLNELEALMATGNQPNEVLRQSMLRGWKGVFELKGNNNGQITGSASRPSITDSVIAALECVERGEL